MDQNTVFAKSFSDAADPQRRLNHGCARREQTALVIVGASNLAHLSRIIGLMRFTHRSQMFGETRIMRITFGCCRPVDLA